MRIKIVKCNSSQYWYANHINEEFNDCCLQPNGHVTLVAYNEWCRVDKDDYEIIHNEPTVIEKLKELAVEWKELNETKTNSVEELNKLYQISRKMVCFIESL